MIRVNAWKCGKCLKLYSTKHEAQRCEIKCLDSQIAWSI